jgi:NADH-quinone oxidoreductase subunit G
MALYAENEGSYINVEGKTQPFSAAVAPPGEARPAWKILRVLADAFGLKHCHYDTVEDIGNEIRSLLAGVKPAGQTEWVIPESLPLANGAVERITDIPMNSVDPLVRRASALQQTPDAADGIVRINGELAAQLGLGKAGRVSLDQDGVQMELTFTIDDRLPQQTVMLHAAHPETFRLGQWFSPVNIRKAE